MNMEQVLKIPSNAKANQPLDKLSIILDDFRIGQKNVINDEPLPRCEGTNDVDYKFFALPKRSSI